MGSSYESVIKKILARARLTLEDLGLDSVDIDPPSVNLHADTEGIDILCQALVNGVHTWMAGKSTAELMSEYWYSGLWQVLQLLRQ
jgi:hypothetical protein